MKSTIGISRFPVSKKNPVACVFYTSGSSGTPKGISLGHSGYVNMSLALIRCFHLTENDRVLQFASYSFDVSMSEIFITLFQEAHSSSPIKKKIDDPQAFPGVSGANKRYRSHVVSRLFKCIGQEQAENLKDIDFGRKHPLMEDVCYYREKALYFNAYGPHGSIRLHNNPQSKQG